MYIMAVDEHGTINWPSRTKTFTYGGFVFKETDKQEITNQWLRIKTELCGSPDVELKWSHFFISDDQSPLLSLNDRRKQLLWALNDLFMGEYYIAPITQRIRKDQAGKECFKLSSKGNTILDKDILNVGIIGQFASFLNLKRSDGEIWLDRLGSIKEQERMQDSWSKLRDCPTHNFVNQKAKFDFHRNQKLLQKIKKELHFFDSKVSQIIQIADFISGVIWAASEGEEDYLISQFEYYFPDEISKKFLLTIK